MENCSHRKFQGKVLRGKEKVRKKLCETDEKPHRCPYRKVRDHALKKSEGGGKLGQKKEPKYANGEPNTLGARRYRVRVFVGESVGEVRDIKKENRRRGFASNSISKGGRS